MMAGEVTQERKKGKVGREGGVSEGQGHMAKVQGLEKCKSSGVSQMYAGRETSHSHGWSDLRP